MKPSPAVVVVGVELGKPVPWRRKLTYPLQPSVLSPVYCFVVTSMIAFPATTSAVTALGPLIPTVPSLTSSWSAESVDSVLAAEYLQQSIHFSIAILELVLPEIQTVSSQYNAEYCGTVSPNGCLSREMFSVVRPATVRCKKNSYLFTVILSTLGRSRTSRSAMPR